MRPLVPAEPSAGAPGAKLLTNPATVTLTSKRHGRPRGNVLAYQGQRIFVLRTDARALGPERARAHASLGVP